MALRVVRSRVRDGAVTAAGTALGLLLRPLFRPSRRPVNARRILVLRRCCLGDVLMTTPLVAALRAAYPEAAIVYATGQWSAPAITNNPDVDRVLALPEPGDLRGWWRLAGRLRRERFDLAALPERSPLVPLVAFLAGIPRRVGFDSAGRGFALTDRVPVRGVRHESDRALDLARALGLSGESRRLTFRPSAAAVERADRLVAEWAIQPPLFLVHPGGGANPGVTMDTKRWSAERFGRVADGLLERHGGTVAFVGAESDREAVRAARAAMRATSLDLAGALDLDTLAALCRHAALYAGNDAGTTHLAEAAGAPTVVVFGPTDPAQYGPLDGVGEAVWDPVACGPYVQRGDLTRPAAGGPPVRCIDAITVEQVLDVAGRVLARAGRPVAAQVAG